MQMGIKHQDSYSRGQLLLRSFFGFWYIIIPHVFVLYFLMVAMQFATMIAGLAILFTGKYPRGIFDFNQKVFRWMFRVQARLFHLADGYPAFGLNAVDPSVKFEVEYPETSSRGLVLARWFFGIFYVAIPHGFVLYFLTIATVVLRTITFWAILITGKHPEGMHKFTTGVLRWQARVSLYMSFMTDKYPPFSLNGDEADFTVDALVENPELIDQF